MPKLGKDEPTLGMDGVGHLAPSFELRLGKDAWDAAIATGSEADICGLSDLQAAISGTIAVVLDDSGTRDVDAGGLGIASHARVGGLYDPCKWLFPWHGSVGEHDENVPG